MAVKVSVCIPTYNREVFLARSIRSIIDQTFNKNEYEVIVVDDGSTDKTDLITSAFKEDIVLIKNKKKIGLSKSLNKAIGISKGKYFLRLDSDDYVNKNYISFLYFMIESNKSFDAVCCDYYLVDEKENIMSREDPLKKPIGCGIIFKIEDLRRVGNYSSHVKIFEDADLIKKLNKKKFNIERLPIPLYRYKRHSSNMTK